VRTVIASSYTPALISGRGVRTYGIVRALLQHGPVDLVWVPFGGDQAAPDFQGVPGLTTHRVETPKPVRRALSYARHRMSGVPDPVARGVSPGLAHLTSQIAECADLVVADDISAALSVTALARARPVVYSAHNLESAFRRGWGSVDRVRRFEADLFARFAEVWMPSRADVRGARELVSGRPVRYVPNVVDVATQPVVRPKGRRAVLVADFTYGPNREALDWLVGDVLPLVRTDYELSVVGRGLDAGANYGPRVRIHGFVDDLDAAYRSSTCALVPLLTGGGSPLKFIEALARGIPVVATPCAARGLDVVAGRHYLEGDGPTGFAAAMDAAFTPGSADQIGLAGRALAEQEYSIESLAVRVAAWAASSTTALEPPMAEGEM